MDNLSLPEKYLKRRLHQKTQETSPSESVDWNEIRAVLAETERLLQDQDTTHAQILQRRADQVAEIPLPQSTPEEHLAAVLFKIGQERYAIRVTAVRAVAEMKHLTPVPCIPSYYQGVTNLDGKIMSVLDLQSFFGIPINTPPNPRRMLIVATGADLEIALSVDEVEFVMDIPRESLILSQVLGQEWLDTVSAVSSDGIILLDTDQLFRDPRIRIYEEPR